MTTFVGQQSVDEGITVTAVQSITDNYYTHIAFKVEGFEIKDGIQPDFEKVKVTVDGKDDFSWGSSFYNGLIQGIDGQTCNADGTPMDENAETIEHYVMPDGSMEYQITLANEQREDYFINKPIHVEMQNLGTVVKAQISPISLRVEYQFPRQVMVETGVNEENQSSVLCGTS